jgi:hypothetical protein
MPSPSEDLTPLPPVNVYSSHEAAKHAFQKWAFQQRYAFTKRRSKDKNKSKLKREMWYCDRHGEPPSFEN